MPSALNDLFVFRFIRLGEVWKRVFITCRKFLFPTLPDTISFPFVKRGKMNGIVGNVVCFNEVMERGEND